ncbi:MAG: transposase [Holosporaceae bacterium]
MAWLRQSEPSIAEIALALGRTRSTVYRELKRNQTVKGDYWPERAQQKARDRRLRGRRLDRDFALKEWVLDRIIYDLWSPEQISGFLKHRQSDIKSISVESIYSWIYDKKQRDEKIWRHLYRRKAKRSRRYRYSGGARISDRVSIHDRPQELFSTYSNPPRLQDCLCIGGASVKLNYWAGRRPGRGNRHQINPPGRLANRVLTPHSSDRASADSAAIP